MKLVNPSVKLVEQKDIWEHIAYGAKICYASETVMSSDSNRFVNGLIDKGHLSVLRHGTVYLVMSSWQYNEYAHLGVFSNPYSRVVIKDYFAYVTTNVQVLFDNNLMNFISLSEQTEHHVKRYSFEIITQISTSRELNRVSPNNITEQSTRYCNYSKNKFGNELTFCCPHWLDKINDDWNDELASSYRVIDDYENIFKENTFSVVQNYINCLKNSESTYLDLIKDGMKPQDARGVLSLDLATKTFYTYFEDEWQNIIDLRFHGKSGVPHPNAKIIAQGVDSIINGLKNVL